MKNLLILLPVEKCHKEKLEAVASNCNIVYSKPDEVSYKTIQEAHIIIGQPKAEMINASSRLELLQLESAGTDDYIKPGILNPKTILTNSSGAYSQAVAEHAFALTLMLQKKLHLYSIDQRMAVWGDRGSVTSLAESTVAVIGLGDIGRYYARLVKSMGAKVIGVKRRASLCPNYVDKLVLMDEINNILPEADIIFSILPNTSETKNIYTSESFNLMKNSAVFINCGRGNAVSQSVLYDALHNYKIAAAAIDVAEVEPLPANSLLWELENLVITPHISGGHHLPQTFERIVDIAVGNLSAYLKGESLMNVIDYNTGYRK